MTLQAAPLASPALLDDSSSYTSAPGGLPLADPPLARALSRTCHLTDFPGVHTPGGWQAALVREVIESWRQAGAPPAPLAIINWSGAPCAVPGDTVYWPELPTWVAQPLGAVIALSVLDRLDAPLRFIAQAKTLLIPGGLILACFAFWAADGPDCAADAAQRRRIYNRKTLERLIYDLRKAGLPTWGKVDWHYGGDVLGDHTIASLVVQHRAQPGTGVQL